VRPPRSGRGGIATSKDGEKERSLRDLNRVGHREFLTDEAATNLKEGPPQLIFLSGESYFSISKSEDYPSKNIVRNKDQFEQQEHRDPLLCNKGEQK